MRLETRHNGIRWIWLDTLRMSWELRVDLEFTTNLNLLDASSKSTRTSRNPFLVFCCFVFCFCCKLFFYLLVWQNCSKLHSKLETCEWAGRRRTRWPRRNELARFVRVRSHPGATRLARSANAGSRTTRKVLARRLLSLQLQAVSFECGAWLRSPRPNRRASVSRANTWCQRSRPFVFKDI